MSKPRLRSVQRRAPPPPPHNGHHRRRHPPSQPRRRYDDRRWSLCWLLAVASVFSYTNKLLLSEKGNDQYKITASRTLGLRLARCIVVLPNVGSSGIHANVRGCGDLGQGGNTAAVLTLNHLYSLNTLQLLKEAQTPENPENSNSTDEASKALRSLQTLNPHTNNIGVDIMSSKLYNWQLRTETFSGAAHADAGTILPRLHHRHHHQRHRQSHCCIFSGSRFGI